MLALGEQRGRFIHHNDVMQALDAIRGMFSDSSLL